MRTHSVSLAPGGLATVLLLVFGCVNVIPRTIFNSAFVDFPLAGFSMFVLFVIGWLGLLQLFGKPFPKATALTYLGVTVVVATVWALQFSLLGLALTPRNIRAAMILGGLTVGPIGTSLTLFRTCYNSMKS